MMMVVVVMMMIIIICITEIYKKGDASKWYMTLETYI
jgi:hypothetical protein